MPCAAHEVRPSYLEVREYTQGAFEVLFKTPLRGDRRLALSAEFTGRIEAVTPMRSRTLDDAALQTWRFRSVDPLRGQTIAVAGLENTMTDALVRVAFLDGTVWVHRLTPQAPSGRVPELAGDLSVSGTYLTLGIEHILTGIDHLLFVLGLLLITRGTWRLVKTITAFTVAHSITLALATRGYVHVPPAPIEALIALSIAFVAVEGVRLLKGREGFTARAPWLVALAFGLLHGLGFASALSRVGLPESNIPVALLFFNLGVEAGQLGFIAVVLCARAALHRIPVSPARWPQLLAPYAIGSIAMFWVIQRVAAF
jgi:hydrogenase/urease accessory protein HupE